MKFILIFIFVILFAVIIWKFFIVDSISLDKDRAQLNIVELSQNSLLDILNQVEISAKEGEIDEVKNLLNTFDKNLGEFIVLSSEKDSIEKTIIEGGGSIGDIRKLEWDLYRIFYSKKDTFELDEDLILQIGGIENQIFKKLENSMISATEVMNLKYWEENSLNKQEGWLFIPIIFAKESLPFSVIYIAKSIDLSDPGSTGSVIQNCWKYESWHELDTQNLREQDQINFGNKCTKEINITSGLNGKKLALDPIDKRAEWIDFNKGKFGISSNNKNIGYKNPFKDFEKKLKSKEYRLEDIKLINGLETYILKKNGYGLAFTLIYVDARTYLPIRETSYQEIIKIERTVNGVPYDDYVENNFFPGGVPQSYIKTEVIYTGEMEKYMNVIIQGRFMDRNEFPTDFFDMEIPSDYRLEDFVSFG